MCLTQPRFVSESSLFICCLYAPRETLESVSDLLLWCLRLQYFTGYSWLICFSLGSDHRDAADRGGSEVHSCTGARSSLGQCKFRIMKSSLSPESSSALIEVLPSQSMQCDTTGRVAEALLCVCVFFQDEGVSENQHQLPVAGKIKKHFNTGPKLNITTAGVSVITVRTDLHPSTH